MSTSLSTLLLQPAHHLTTDNGAFAPAHYIMKQENLTNAILVGEDSPKTKTTLVYVEFKVLMLPVVPSWYAKSAPSPHYCKRAEHKYLNHTFYYPVCYLEFCFHHHGDPVEPDNCYIFRHPCTGYSPPTDTTRLVLSLRQKQQGHLETLLLT